MTSHPPPLHNETSKVFKSNGHDLPTTFLATDSSAALTKTSLSPQNTLPNVKMTGCYPRQRRYIKGKEQGPYGQKSFLCPIILLAKLSLKNVRDPLKEALHKERKRRSSSCSYCSSSSFANARSFSLSCSVFTELKKEIEKCWTGCSAVDLPLNGFPSDPSLSLYNFICISMYLHKLKY